MGRISSSLPLSSFSPFCRFAGLAGALAFCSAVFAAGPQVPQVIPGEYLVKLNGTAIEVGPVATIRGHKSVGQVKAQRGSRLEKLAQKHKLIGGEKLASAKTGGADVVRFVFPENANAAAVVNDLKQLPGAALVEPNYVGSLSFTPTDPLYASQQQADYSVIGMEDAWAVQAGASSSVKVAVIDSGFDVTHPDLSQVIDTADSYNFVDSNTTILDDIGHGTRVSGIIGASGNNSEGIAGVAFGCRIMSLDVTDTTGVITTARVISALNWAVSHGANIANMSLRFSSNSQLLKDACDTAAASGVLLVAAAGNENQGSSPVYPASYDSVIGVGAIADDGVSRASYSNYNGTDKTIVKLVAPGDTLFSCIPGAQYNGTYGSGTSFAAPLVAGTAALLKTKYPTQSANAIKTHLLNTAQAVSGSFAPAGSAGYGKLSAKFALETAMTPAISVASVTIDDSTSVFAGNNNDGTLDKGETVRVIVSLKNTGADAVSVTGTLATTDPLVTVTDPSAAWGTVSNGATQSATDVFSTVTLSGSSTAHQVPLTIALSANSGAYTPTLSVNVQAENSVTVNTGNYFALQTWTSGNTYEVKGTQNFNAGLTVQPGTVVKLGPAADLNVNGGALTANGTSTLPIQFTSIAARTTLTPLTGIGPKTEAVNTSGYGRAIYVDQQLGIDAPLNGSSTSPYKSIGYAISSVSGATETNLHCILVAEGTYSEQVSIPAWTTLFGGFTPGSWTRDIYKNKTILNGHSQYNCKIGINARLDGCFIVRSNEEAINFNNHPGIVSNNFIGFNTSTYGGLASAIDNTGNGNQTTITCNLLFSNDGGGSAILAQSSWAGTWIEKNIFLNNGGGFAGSIAVNSGVLYVERNYIGNGITAFNNAEAIMRNNIVNGTANSFNNGLLTSVNDTFAGSITASSGTFSGTNIVAMSLPSGGGASCTYSCLPSAMGGTGNIVADPLFGGAVTGGVITKLEYDEGQFETTLVTSSPIPPSFIGSIIRVGGTEYFVISVSSNEVVVVGDAAQNQTLRVPTTWSYYDYRIRAGSPCIDSGTNSGAAAVDFNGTSRPINGGIALKADMGMYEYNQASPPFRASGQIYIKSTASSSSMSYCSVENVMGIKNESNSSQFQNSNFSNCFSDGLLSTAGTSDVSSCTATGNLLNGLSIGSRPATGSAAVYNVLNGLAGTSLINCTAYGNGSIGITGNSAIGCTSEFNGATGLSIGGDVTSCSAISNVGTGISSSSNVIGSSAFSNFLDGINISGGGTAVGCSAGLNLGNGIVTNGSSISNCYVTSNTGIGVMGSGASNLSGSLVSSNGGMAASGVSSITGCKLVGNGAGVSGASTFNTNYIAANLGTGISGGAISNSTIVGNLGFGASTPSSVTNCWVMNNTSNGIDSPTGNITLSSIRNNGGVGVRNLPGANLLNNCNLYGNTIYDYFDNLNNAPGGYPSDVKDCRFNFWGAASTLDMTANPFPSIDMSRIYDEFDNSLANGWYVNYGGAGEFATTAVPNAPDSTPPAFLLDVTPNTANSINVGYTTFTLTFSKAMDTTVDPAVTFGLSSPYDNHVVEPAPGWINSTTWQGSFWVQSDTGNGLSTLRVGNATAADGFVIPDDTSHQFTVDTSGAGSANNGLAITVGASRANLNWSENEKPVTAAGFDVKRSLTADGQFIKINTSLQTTPLFYDLGVPTGSQYYYQVWVVTSDVNATQWTPTTRSPIVAAAAKDTDGDGFEDLVEVRAGTDPNSFGSQPPSGFPYNSAADFDGDGYKDFYEYEMGTNASSASSYPSLGNVDKSTGVPAVNGADAIILKRIAVGTIDMSQSANFNKYDINAMDLNRDGAVNGADAIILQRYIVHTVTLLPTN